MVKGILRTLIVLCILMVFIPEFSIAQILSGGSYHSLTICSSTNTAISNGLNNHGQLGNGTTINTNTPGAVNSLSGIIAVSAGNYHSVFLKSNGTVWACGLNEYGQLGDGTNTNSNTPVQVSNMTEVIGIAAGGDHTFFLKSDSTVWACGSNPLGELGDGTNTDRSTPVQVVGLSGIIDVSTGLNHALFLKNDGSVWACGNNMEGELGDGTNTSVNVPQQVNPTWDGSIIAIAAGGYHSLFLKSDGSVWSCGYNNTGQLGDGTNTNKNLAVQAIGLTGITALAAGQMHSVFLDNNGAPWACGFNGEGELGDGSNTNKNMVVQLNSTFGGEVTHIAAGAWHTLLIRNDGTQWGCGYNISGQLGNGINANSNVAIERIGGCTPLGMVDTKNDLDFSLFPNPSTGHFNINYNNELQLIEVFNLNQVRVLQRRNSNELNLSDFPKGIYIVKMYDHETTVVSKLVLQ
jgi:alpha-tubulin suppressor-like RCC1 family protein